MSELDRLSHLESGQSKFLVLTRPSLELAGTGGKSQHRWESLCCGPPLPGAGLLQVCQDLRKAVGDEWSCTVMSRSMVSLFGSLPELGL